MQSADLNWSSINIQTSCDVEYPELQRSLFYFIGPMRLIHTASFQYLSLLWRLVVTWESDLRLLTELDY